MLRKLEALRQAIETLIERQIPPDAARMRSMHDPRSEFSVSAIRKIRGLDEALARIEDAFREEK